MPINKTKDRLVICTTTAIS